MRRQFVRLSICVLLVLPFMPSRASTPAAGTPFFFHSGGAPVNNIDSATFDRTAPTGSQSLAVTSGASPVIRGAWTGKVGAVISTLKVDFWQYALIGEPGFGDVDYDVTLTAGGKDYTFPTFTEPASETDIPAQVTHLFAKGEPGSPLPIDASSGDVTISIQGHYVDSEAATVIVYDSTSAPSGFTVNAPAPKVEIPAFAKTVPSTMTFSPNTVVDPQYFGSEPSIWVDDKGVVFVSAIFGSTNQTSFVWRSRDGGRTFEILDAMLGAGIEDPRHRPCTLSGGGGDSDIVEDHTGRLYLVDLETAGVASNVSADGGDTWTCNTLAGQDKPPVEDRQWVAPAPGADGDGPAIDAYLSFLPTVSGGIELDVTRDGGKTWTFQSTYAPDVSQNGALFTYKDGTLYHAFYEGSTPMLARSEDQGKTFALLTVAKTATDVGNDFTAADVDAAGNLYYAWVQAGTFDVLYATSTDRGEHWSKPIRLNPPESNTTVFPWIAAGKNGDVAVAWYGTPTGTDPSSEPATATWNVWLARSLNGTAANPTFQIGKMTQTPVHFGSICLSGLGCDIPPEGDRSLGDFFEIDIAPDGAVLAAFDDNGRQHSTLVPTFPGPYVAVVRQESGLGMAASAAAIRPETKGDATFPRHDPSGVNVPQLDVSGPTAQALGMNLKVQFSLGDAKDLTPALLASDGGLGTDAYWLAIWWAHNKRQYAVLHLSQTSGTEFYGGDDPSAVTREPNNEKYATYPNQIAVTGTIDQTTGRVTMEAPLSAYGLSPSDTISGLQVFSMTGVLSERTLLTPLDVLDMTQALNTPLTKQAAVLGSKEKPKPVTKPVTKKRPARSGKHLAATGLGTETGPAVALLIGACALAVVTRRKVVRA